LDKITRDSAIKQYKLTYYHDSVAVINELNMNNVMQSGKVA
jgi:hypothetical protein